MSNRNRPRRTSGSYAARVQRSSLPGAPGRLPAAVRLAGRTPWLLASLAVAAEVGHLAAAYVEWPGSAARGVYHVLAGALLGLVAVAARAGSGRPLLGAGAAVAAAGPLLWLAGGLLGVSPYAELPVPAAAALAAVELALAALLAGALLAARSQPAGRSAQVPAARPPADPPRRPVRPGRAA